MCMEIFLKAVSLSVELICVCLVCSVMYAARLEGVKILTCKCLTKVLVNDKFNK